MEYKYSHLDNYSQFSSGQFFFRHKTIPAFPIRAINELFQYVYYEKLKDEQFVSIYDPCCGSAYHLAALGYLHNDKINEIHCSDIDNLALGIAKKNLDLLIPCFAEERLHEIIEKHKLFKKNNYLNIYNNSKKLLNFINQDNKIQTKVFKSNIANPIKSNKKYHIIFADIPYSNMSTWRNIDNIEILELLIKNSFYQLKENGVLIIASAKKEKINIYKFSNKKKINIGKRMITILQKNLNTEETILCK